MLRKTQKAPIVEYDQASGELTSSALKHVLAEVERDEAQAISLLVSLLDRVRETSNTGPLEAISKVVIQWQNRPPGGIVTDLMKIRDELNS